MLKLATKENVLGALILGLSISGARLQNNFILYSMLFLVLLSIILVSLDKLKPTYLLIFSISLALVWQTTLMTDFLVGTDVHREFYYGYLSYTSGWDHTRESFYNTSLASSILAPLLPKIFHVGLYFIYKAIFPILLALIPTVLFYLFKTQFKDKISFLSCIFFVSIPTYLLELTGISKQQFSELFFTLTLVLLIVPLNPKLRYTFILLCLILTILAHYTLGLLLLGILPPFILVMLFKKNRKVELKYLIFILVLGVAVYGGYYSWVSEGRVVSTGGQLLQNFVGWSPSFLHANTVYASEWGGRWNPAGAEWAWITPGNSTIFTPVPLTKVALGFDFFQVSNLGKTFRVFQILTESLLVLGCLVLFRMRKKLSPEYLALCLVSAAMMAAIIIIPGASATMNATRFYNIALLTLAPAFVLGGLAVLKKPWLLVALVMIPYLLFTSGFIFEVSHQTEVGTDLPYTHALSAERVDTTGLFTENDGIVRDWIMSNPQARPIIADWHTLTLLQDKLDSTKGLELFPSDLSKIPNNFYVFLRTRNEKYQEIGYWVNIGTTVEVPYEQAGVSKMLEGRQIVFQSGLAKLYGPKELE